MPDFIEVVKQAAMYLGIKLTPHQATLMQQHFELLVAANQRINLTRITDPAGAAVRLYADSLAPIAWSKAHSIKPRTVLDVGTGAGFPAIPLAIVRPNWRITAVDSTGKKARFVADCAAKLELNNLNAVKLRAGSDTESDRYDLVTFKAVGPPQICVHVARDLVNPGGYVAVFQSACAGGTTHVNPEAADKKSIFRLLGPFEYHISAGDQDWKMQLAIFQRY